MLGCQDFCGHYDWTFHYVRRRWGQTAVEALWREAIAGESQRHYAIAGAESGLRGLYETWTKTGDDEHCDWTFTLDEQKNVLRWDMRQCPSKGFLLQNDLAGDEDYCNHCMGWVIPMLESIGGEVIAHEHNHSGQCWATMRMKDRPSEPLSVAEDIRDDPRWRQGYLDRWTGNRQLPVLPKVSQASDPCEVLEAWYRAMVRLGEANESAAAVDLFSDDLNYNDCSGGRAESRAVLIGCPPADLAATAARWQSSDTNRPLLLHAYLPGLPFVDFVAAGLPRPLPILPLLIRRGLYTHHSGGPYPTTTDFLKLLRVALGERRI